MNYNKYLLILQIAQTPDRHEPTTAGELNFRYIFEQIEKYYDPNDKFSWIGCEYKPLTTTQEGLGWIREFGYSLD